MAQRKDPKLEFSSVSYSVALNDGSGLSLHYDTHLSRKEEETIEVILSDGEVETASMHMALKGKKLTKFNLVNAQALVAAYERVRTHAIPDYVQDTLSATRQYVDPENEGISVARVRKRQEEKAGESLRERIDSFR